ncbi:MAG: CCA tRNA nucleotidyltransferase [Myxococcota bacterium]
MSVHTLFPAPLERLTLPSLPPIALTFAREVALAGGRALLVGGFVRDLLLGHSPGDLDLEVFGIDAPQLETLAQRLARGKLVGKDFGILKLEGLDVSLPRAERQAGRDGFFQASPWLSFAEASRRRDFTLNALACDPLTGELFDAWGGLADLRAGILRPVAQETFVEDPLRVLRALQFVSRLPLEPAPLTRTLCQQLAPVLPSLPRERIFEELKKLLLKSRWPERGIQLALETGVLQALLPELPLSPSHGVLVRRLARLVSHRPQDEEQALALGMALLLWELAAAHTQPPLQVEPVTHMPSLNTLLPVLDRLTHERRLRQRLISILLLKGSPDYMYTKHKSSAAVRRLALHGTLSLLIAAERCVAEADERPSPALDWLEQEARQLQVLEQAEPMWIQGRDLAALGLSQGPLMGKLLKRLYGAQLDRTFQSAEEGKRLAPKLLQTLLEEESGLAG